MKNVHVTPPFYNKIILCQIVCFVKEKEVDHKRKTSKACSEEAMSEEYGNVEDDCRKYLSK
ncbi:MAG: hypothetical protein U0O17_11445 [Longicatena caecimuris]|jgi:hypothetical protein|uniref:hypothetical protein n=1 Tax=Longicatena caecimuris TaxID=1796635 RepID=UPI0002FBF8D4|nr:hypothetical protein [Longicatena caecimuris]RJV78876.1 hypothetical protein DW969_05935 [Eubacterium sp. AM47-9]RJV80060.1 hypothetical protein DWX37_06830 [Eubacterium sp. AF19-17]RJV86869.1 hypothetical protein DWX13_06125 [Eubacterium sp. AF18-3]RJW00559.1 hypothetical protein DW840_02745 [Eubacterium sp. AM35-6AC]RJW09509.1 hypothetical protein DW751_05540 [Eubacterium sp. AM28-8LB]RJW17316.1 hypothetical protein DXD20_07700 [Eubacterium sp. TF12-12]RJW24346.1 hypothetical protein DX